MSVNTPFIKLFLYEESSIYARYVGGKVRLFRFFWGETKVKMKEKFIYRRKEYYLKLLSLLEKYNLFTENKYWKVYVDDIDERFYKKTQEYVIDKKELCENKKLERATHKYFIKFLLWRKQFCDNYNEKAIELAVYFNTFCCLIDAVLDDESNIVSKQSALNRIEWENVGDYFGNSCYEKKEDIIDIFLEKMSKLSLEVRNYDNELFDDIRKNIELALKSEIYVSTHYLNLQQKEIDLCSLTDKSTKFVKACFQLASVGTKDRQRMDECAEDEATIFLLVDDLCDLYDDIDNNVMNSILYKHISNATSIQEIVDEIIDYLESYVQEISSCTSNMKQNVSRELYEYLYTHVLDWCSCVKDKIQDFNNED